MGGVDDRFAYKAVRAVEQQLPEQAVDGVVYKGLLLEQRLVYAVGRFLKFHVLLGPEILPHGAGHAVVVMAREYVQHVLQAVGHRHYIIYRVIYASAHAEDAGPVRAAHAHVEHQPLVAVEYLLYAHKLGYARFEVRHLLAFEYRHAVNYLAEFLVQLL